MSYRTGKSFGIAKLGLAVLTATIVFGAAKAANEQTPATLIKDGHWKRARAAVEPELKSHPDDAELNYLMSEIADAFGETDHARELAEKAVALKPGDARYHRQLGDVDGETAEHASLFAKGGWAKKFKSECETAASLDAKYADPRFDLLEYDLQAPRLMGGGVDKAEAMAAEIAKIDPAQGDLAEARLAQNSKDVKAQEEWYLKAVAAAPNDYDILTAVAQFYVTPPDLRADRVEKYAVQAIKVEPNRALAYSQWAFALAFQGRGGELESALAESQKQVPDDLVAYYQAARAILTKPSPSAAELARAEAYLSRYLAAPPEAQEPTPAHAHWRLGLVLEKEGRKPDAVAEIETALRLKPDLEPAKKDLKRLQ